MHLYSVYSVPGIIFSTFYMSHSFNSHNNPMSGTLFLFPFADEKTEAQTG